MTRSNLIGKRFGRLVVIERAESDAQRNSRWLCVCDCGTKKVVRIGHLVTANTKSCGCLRKEYLARHRGPPGEKTKRNLEIADAYHAGNVTYRELGKRYGLSHNRIKQIVDRRQPTRRTDDFDDREVIQANNLLEGPEAEAFARALDTLGWMIVQQPKSVDGAPVKWPMDPKYGPVPKWADGGTQTPERQHQSSPRRAAPCSDRRKENSTPMTAEANTPMTDDAGMDDTATAAELRRRQANGSTKARRAAAAQRKAEAFKLRADARRRAEETRAGEAASAARKVHGLPLIFRLPPLAPFTTI
jgi:hypothetical protein